MSVQIQSTKYFDYYNSNLFCISHQEFSRYTPQFKFAMANTIFSDYKVENPTGVLQINCIMRSKNLDKVSVQQTQQKMGELLARALDKNYAVLLGALALIDPIRAFDITLLKNYEKSLADIINTGHQVPLRLVFLNKLGLDNLHDEARPSALSTIVRLCKGMFPTARAMAESNYQAIYLDHSQSLTKFTSETWAEEFVEELLDYTDCTFHNFATKVVTSSLRKEMH